MAAPLAAAHGGTARQTQLRIEGIIAGVTERLRAHHGLSDNQIERAQRAAEASGERLDLALNKLGLVSDDALMKVYSEVTGVKVADNTASPDAIPEGIDPLFLRTNRLLPLEVTDDVIRVAVADPVDLRSAHALALRLNRTLDVCLLSRADIERSLSMIAQRTPIDATNLSEHSPEVAADDIDRLRDIASEAPVIRLVAETIESAFTRGASDIHITRNAEAGRIRYRIDGQLSDVRGLSPRLHQAVISRLKIMASLDIGERRLPQDGRIQISAKGREIDLRISTMPHAHGEGAFIRILDNRAANRELAGLGFNDAQTNRIRQILSHPHGLFLITGPTGSGKTTTLYAALRHLNDPSKNIVTVEDPVEFTIAGINQIQVNRKAGLDFARTLRSVLRQDPDIIMIGEIRDRETAAIAVQAALTGHLVLATLHTNDALSAIDRLLDMDVEPFLLGSILRGTMAQRLVRKLTGKGVFSGRAPLAEVVPVGQELQDAIINRRDHAQLSRIASALGYETLADAGKSMVETGVTNAAEIARALGE